MQERRDDHRGDEDDGERPQRGQDLHRRREPARDEVGPAGGLDRVADLEVCAETFKRPADFDARSYLRERMPFVQSDYQIDVWIDMPIEEAERTFAPWRVATREDQGGTRVFCGRDQLQMFAAMLLSMGRRIVVHEPAELKATFIELAARAIQASQ